MCVGRLLIQLSRNEEPKPVLIILRSAEHPPPCLMRGVMDSSEAERASGFTGSVTGSKVELSVLGAPFPRTLTHLFLSGHMVLNHHSKLDPAPQSGLGLAGWRLGKPTPTAVVHSDCSSCLRSSLHQCFHGTSFF